MCSSDLTPHLLFGGNVYDDLPTVAQIDLSESCRCLAFESPTAAAFHMLRATEAALKELYLCYVKTRRLPKPMWAAMVTALEQRSRGRPPKHLLEALDHIRNAYRNPTSHPDMVYMLQKAEDLLGLCLDVINQMYAATNAKKS